MSKRWTEVLMVAPMIASAIACNITNNTSESAGSATATTTQGTESDSATETVSTTAGTGETTGGNSGVVTIYDIQKGDVAVDSIVELKNVVFTTPVMYDKSAAFVQEMPGGEYSGIYVYMYSEVIDSLDLTPGDVVNLKGLYTEYYDFSEITVKSLADIEIVSSGPVPEPAIVSPADVATGGPKAEAYESVLVKVVNVMVTNPDLGFGEFEVDGSLHIDDFFYPAMGPVVSNGDSYESIVGAMMWNFDNFKLAPRSLDDLVGGGSGTTTGTTTTTTTGGGDVTIYDLQMDKVPVKTDVVLKDVIVTSPLSFSGDTFYVEDPAAGPYSGIAVFLKDPTGVVVKPGDVVTLTGYYDEYFMNSQMVLNDGAGLSLGGTMPVPAAEVVSASDIATGGAQAEAYEGVLVTVEGVTVTNPDLGFGEFEVTGMLRVDDFFFAMADWPAVAMGDKYMSITGPLNYNFDNTKVCPRTVADLTK